MYAQPGLGLLIEAARANDERRNRLPAETGQVVQPALHDRVLWRTGQWMIRLGQRLKTASHAHPLQLFEETV